MLWVANVLVIWALLIWTTRRIIGLSFHSKGHDHIVTIKGMIGRRLDSKNIDRHLTRRRSERIRAIKGESGGLLMRGWKQLDEEVRSSPSWNMGAFIMLTISAGTVGFIMTSGDMGVLVGSLSAIGCAMIPYFIMRLGRSASEADRHEKLLVAMANIQGEYAKKTVPFVVAVNHALPTIPEPLYSHFKTFVDTLLILNPDHPMAAYKVLERKVDQYFFTEYLSLIRLVEEGDTGLKATLEAVPEAYQAYLDHNRGYREQVDRMNENFIMTLLTLPMILIFIQRISPEYHTLLMGTIPGQGTLVLVFSGFIGAAVLFIRYNNPVIFEI